jgi:hypothetical protein
MVDVTLACCCGRSHTPPFALLIPAPQGELVPSDLLEADNSLWQAVPLTPRADMVLLLASLLRFVLNLFSSRKSILSENAVLKKENEILLRNVGMKRSGLGQYRIRGSSSRSRNLAKQREPVVSPARLLCSADYTCTTSGMPRDVRNRSHLRAVRKGQLIIWVSVRLIGRRYAVAIVARIRYLARERNIEATQPRL